MARPTLRVFLLALVVVPGAAQNLYQVLEVPKDAPAADIKRAYRRLARQWHPDKSKAPEAPERFREVAEAYEVLGDQEKRRQYDEEEGGLSFDITFAHAEDIFKAFFGDEDPFANLDEMFEDVQREFFDGVQQDLGHAATRESRASEESGGWFSTISSFVSSFTSFSSSQGGEVKITTRSSESRVEPDGRKVTKTVATQSDGTGTKVTVEELDSSPRGVGGNAPPVTVEELDSSPGGVGGNAPPVAAAHAGEDDGAESAKGVQASEPEAPSKAGPDSTDGASALDGDVSTCASLADCRGAASTGGPTSGSPGSAEANTTTDLESNSIEPADVPGADVGTPMGSRAPVEPAASEASVGMGGDLEDLGQAPAEQALASEESAAQKPASEAGGSGAAGTVENLHRPPVEPVASAEPNAAEPAGPAKAVRAAETAEASASAGPGGKHEPLVEPTAEAEPPEEVTEAPAVKADAVEAAQATTADQRGSAESRGELGTAEATAGAAAAAGSAGPVPQRIDGVAGAATGSGGEPTGGGGSLAAAYAALSRSNTPVGRCASPFSRDAGALGTARFRSLSTAGMLTEQRDTQGASTPMQGSSGYPGMMAGNMAGMQGSSGYPGMAAGSMASSYYSLGGAPAYGGQPASMAPPASGSSPFAWAAPNYAGQTGNAYGASPGATGIAEAGVCDSLPYVSNVEPIDTAVRHVLGSACCNTAPQSTATNQYGCCQRCMSNANCQVYVWQPSAGTCWLLQWKTAHTTVNAPDRVMGERVSVT